MIKQSFFKSIQRWLIQDCQVNFSLFLFLSLQFLLMSFNKELARLKFKTPKLLFVGVVRCGFILNNNNNNNKLYPILFNQYSTYIISNFIRNTEIVYLMKKSKFQKQTQNHNHRRFCQPKLSELGSILKTKARKHRKHQAMLLHIKHD